MSCTELRRIIQTLYLITIKITQPTLQDHIAHPCQTPLGWRATGGGGGAGSEGSGGSHINSYKKGIYQLNDYGQYHCIITESNKSATVHLVDSFYGYMDQTYREQCEERRQFSKLDVITIAISELYDMNSIHIYIRCNLAAKLCGRWDDDDLTSYDPLRRLVRSSMLQRNLAMN